MLVTTYLQKCCETIDFALRWLDNLPYPRNGDPLSANTSSKKPFCSKYLFVWQDSGFKKITIDDIEYLEASRSYCELHLANGSNMVVSVPMSEVVKHLHSDLFIHIHRSFIINLRHVNAIMGNTIVMEDGSKLPVSKAYRNIMLTYFTFVGSKSRKYIL